ncbi:MAG: SAM-dependent methyltransferase [Steroidobacteraceae bacterium]
MLPPLDAAQAAHGEAVRRSLRALLAARGGWLSFADYMSHVLYAPGLGYYSAGSAKFGAQGDFITAPELSPLFGGCLARQCAPLLAATRGDVLELGAGSGELAATLLTRLAGLGALPRRYLILEISPDLRERQRQRLAQLPAALSGRVQWLDALPAEPIDGVLLANEVADALPVHCFAVTLEGFVERGVALDAAGELCWQPRPAEGPLASELEELLAALPEGLPEDYCSEVCLLAGPWMRALSGTLRRGLMLLIDYGLGRNEYYHAERSSGTLRCHYRQRAHDDPFLHPGLQDITAWVDFTRLADAAAQAGLEVAGYGTQAGFLLGSGIEAELAGDVDAITRARMASEARQLLLPDEMGETFKVLALTRGWTEELSGFRYQDLRRQL